MISLHDDVLSFLAVAAFVIGVNLLGYALH